MNSTDTFRSKHKDYEWCDNRPAISLTQKRKKFSAKNNNNKYVCCYHSDTGDATEGQKVCDYILCVSESEESSHERLYFIELKGSDIDHALKQIYETIIDSVVNFDLKPVQIDARIVAAKVKAPNISTTHRAKLKTLLKRFGEGEIKLATNSMHEEI